MKDNNHAYARHAETTVEIAAPASELFAFLDDHHNLSSHMANPSSPMMGGGQMELILDEGKGRVLGSHVVMRGSAFGLRLFVDEIVATRTPPITKSWKTVAERLIVIGAYTLGFTIAGNGTELNRPGFGSASYWRMDHAPSVFAGVPAARVAAVG